MDYDRKRWPYWRRTPHWGVSVALAIGWVILTVLAFFEGSSTWRLVSSGAFALVWGVVAAVDLARVRRFGGPVGGS